MTEVFQALGSVLATGGDAALIVIAAAIYKLDKRVSKVETRLDFIFPIGGK